MRLHPRRPHMQVDGEACLHLQCYKGKLTGFSYGIFHVLALCHCGCKRAKATRTSQPGSSNATRQPAT